MDIAKYLPHSPSLKGSETVIDFETSGLNFRDKDFKIVGLSFANQQWPQGVYFCTKDANQLKMRALYHALSSRPLIAHNFVFDGSVLQRMATDLELPKRWHMIGCTHGMACQLENKLSIGGSKLKQLQQSHLGWDVRGDVELDDWLVRNGYTTKPVVHKPGTPIDWSKYKADKSRMSMAPSNILGKYGGLDSQSTWSLYRLYKRSMKKFPELDLYHTREYSTLGKLAVEQAWGGFNVDEKRLRIYYRELFDKLIEIEGEFRASDAAPFIDEYNRMELEEHLAKEKYPFTSNGSVSKNWLKWNDKIEYLEQNLNRFKIAGTGSDTGLKWLFFERLFETTPPKLVKDRRGDYQTVQVMNDSGEMLAELRLSKAGRMPFDKEIIPKLGTCGEILARYNELLTEVGQIKNMIDSLVKGVHYPGMKLSGTVSGRCAGGGTDKVYRTFNIPMGVLPFKMYTDLTITCADLRVLGLKPNDYKEYEGPPSKGGKVNIQNQKKTARYMECIRPPKGEDWLQMDVDALEPVVLAELSGDEAMMNLYGPGAKPNDIYLFVGASIPALRDEVCAYGYDPLNPTAEAIAVTKKKAKRIRGICKVVHLSAGYGAGPGTIYATLIQAGVVITLDEVKAIHKAYWALFGGVIEYQKKLKAEWAENGGWFINGRGMPVAVADNLEKDILNRCIQNTGHMNMLT